MADKQDGQFRAVPGSQLVQECQNLLLDGHVQRGGRLVADQELRFDGKRSGNRRALALAAAHLIWIALGKFRRKAAVVQKLCHFPLCLFPAHPAVAEAFAHAVAQGASWVKGLRRRLENHLHLPVDLAQLAALCVGYILAVQDDTAHGCVQQTGDHVDDSGLAAAALAYKAEALPGVQVKGNMVDGGEIRLSGTGEDPGQIIDFQKRFHLTRSLNAVRQPSESGCRLPSAR